MITPDTSDPDHFHQVCKDAADQFGVELGNSSFSARVQEIEIVVMTDEKFLSERGVARVGGEQKALHRFRDAVRFWWPKCAITVTA
jgi:hypothetical protein